ncbi:Z1 domain-containing protein [Kineococcus sp. SYSU DK003]|uniref:Z1 domain-containing protein n=1 Tax=Kineococcus sp. SYSU DK003 TaxID=3383124 RepID=UPI003D7EB734
MSEDFFPVFAGWARQHGLDEASQRFGPVLEGPVLERFVLEYQRRIDTIETDDPVVLHGPRDPWYAGPNEDADVYWPKLKQHFEEALGWSERRIEPVDRSSTKVVAYTPRPQLPRWASKGLVVGYVQSGKTTNFTSVIAKAADAGYKLVIVLSGIHNGLRRQTQERLNEQLRDLVPTDWLTLTDEHNDFRPHSMPATALLHNQGSKVALCVVKKNKAVLTKLDAWLEGAARKNVLDDVPVLVIDDEADQATVATATINPLIKKILGKLPRCTYIGYTATPFANVLIRPGQDDLYPDDFILNLPKPEGYFGSERIFGRDAVEGDEASGADLDGYDMVRLIGDDELDSLRPAGKSAAATFKPAVTGSLRAAALWFWMATAARRARGDAGHSTMLIHTSMKIAVHEAFKEPLVELRDNVLFGVRHGDEQLLEELEATWRDESGKVPASQFGVPTLTFEGVLDRLPEVVASTKVILDNCASEDRLDYSGEPQVAIAVGGNTLSRGLTLDGLVVSFFVRSAQAYDTLLQMARWFGFRPGYEDLPRIWMTPQLEQWFRHLATVEHEIRLDIDRYEQQDLTPTEFGVRIRTHPVLRVTGKMGAWVPAYASYGGRRIQTRYFVAGNESWLQGNVDAAHELVRDARAAGAQGEQLPSGGRLFRDVEAEIVERFLRRYESHPDSPDLDRELVLNYIAKERESGSLERWSVAVMSAPNADLGTVRLGGLDFGRIARAQLSSGSLERADIKTLMSKDHRVVDLDITPAAARGMAEHELMTARNDDPIAHERGLLLIYPIDPTSTPDAANTKRKPLNATADVIGMALVFPGNAESRVKMTHVTVNLTPAEVESPDDAELAELTGQDAT